MSKLREMVARKEEQQERYYRAVVSDARARDGKAVEQPVFGAIASRYKDRIKIHHA